MTNNHNKMLLIVIVAAISVANALKVPVTIYYESLCPDSAKFINEQVYPNVKNDFKDHVEITWIPFGKSQYTTQGSDVIFTCHHGPNECYGNKVHACAIEHIQANSYQTEFTRESLTLDFINCMMKAGKNFPDNVYPGARCAHENHISTWENIQQCANSTEGSHLLMKYGQETNKFQNPLQSVPTIVFKDQYDEKLNKRAQTDFLGAMCKILPQPQPRICATASSGIRLNPTTASLFTLFLYILAKVFA